MPAVPTFTALTYADLGQRFREWLEQDHGLSQALAENLAAFMIARRLRGIADE